MIRVKPSGMHMYGIFLCIVFIVLDQLSKWYARSNFTTPVKIAPFLDFILVYNKGVGFSLFNSGTGTMVAVLVLGTLVLIGVVVYWIISEDNKIALTGLYLILSGALGNLIDRISMGKVTDFIDFYYDKYHFPTFNIADIVISVGGFLFVCSAFICSAYGKKHETIVSGDDSGDTGHRV